MRYRDYFSNERDYLVVTMRDRENMMGKEIADKLGLSTGAVSNIYRRGKRAQKIAFIDAIMYYTGGSGRERRELLYMLNNKYEMDHRRIVEELIRTHYDALERFLDRDCLDQAVNIRSNQSNSW